MFISDIARPDYNKDGTCIFEGKIKKFSFTTIEATKRASKNRGRGVVELKPIERINKVVVKRCLTEKIILTIKAKWSTNCNKHILVQ